MANAALLPALAILAGIVAGVLLPAVDPRLAGALLIAAWSCALAAHVRGLDGIVTPAAAVAFAVCGALLSARALDVALHSTLRRVLEEADVLDETKEVEAVVLEGRLRTDAAQGPSGVGLSLEVSKVTIGERSEAVAGGVLLGVSGDLAALASSDWTAGRWIRAPALLRRPARYLDPGVPDEDRLLARRGVAVVGTVKSAAVVEIAARGHVWDEWAAAIRAWTRRSIAAHVGTWSLRSAAIVTALLIGDRAGLDDEVERRLQEAGTYHVIAISGGNIALLAGAMAGVLAILRVANRRAAIASILALLAYAFIVGGGASVVRATAMAIVYLAARLGDHRSPPMNVLGVAAAIILCISPLSILEAGFVLTFGATLAILVGARLLRGRLPSHRVLRAAGALFVASVSAEVALFPVGAYIFSRVTFAGLLLNFAAIPLMGVAQLAGMATLAAGALSSRAAHVTGFIAHLGAAGVIASARAVDLAPWTTYRVPPPSMSVVGIYYAALFAWLAFHGRHRAVCATCGTIVFASAAWILTAPTSLVRSRSTGILAATFFDVGQGDSALVRAPNGRTLLVDAGGVSVSGGFDVGARVLAPALWAMGVRRLTYLVLTHGDPDHIGGALAILRDFAPTEVWYGTPVPPHEPTNNLIAQASERGAAWRTVVRGDGLDLGGVHLRVWHPPPPDWERQRVRNDDSIVTELTFGDASIVLTGDIGREGEQDTVTQLSPARLRVVKVAHHGSGTSSSPEFVQAAKPAVAVISCGRRNRYGHPVPYIVDRYKNAGAAVFRTDQDGAVTVRTDGHWLTVSTYTGRMWRVAR